MQARCMGSDVSYAQNKICGELVLDFQAPILNHAWTAVFRSHIVGKLAVEEGGVLRIRGWRETGETGIQGLHGAEAVLRFEIRSRRGATGQGIPEIRVAQSRIINAIAATDHS